MWIWGTLDLVGCIFSGNSATNGIGDIYSNYGTVNIDGCPAGFSGAATGDLLVTFNDNNCEGDDGCYYYVDDYYVDDYYGDDDSHDFGTISTVTGEKRSYSCVACVR